MPLSAEAMGEGSHDKDLSEYAVRVRWIDNRPRSEAYWEFGMFAGRPSANHNAWTVKYGHGAGAPPGLLDQILDLLQWDRQTWDIDPPAGWDPEQQRFRGLDNEGTASS